MNNFRDVLRVDIRERLETDIARGVRNIDLMRTYRLTYEQLRTFIDAMDDGLSNPPSPMRTVASCGTETAWVRHHRERFYGCGVCEQAHHQRKAQRAASRAAAFAEKRVQRRHLATLQAEARRDADAERQQRGVA